MAERASSFDSGDSGSVLSSLGLSGLRSGLRMGDPVRFVLVSDLDWTMVDHKDATHDKLLQFNRLWVTEFATDSLLVFSTGRSPHLYRVLADEVPLLTPDILVCSVGTEIFVNGQPLEPWERHLDVGWDRARAALVAARFPELQPQVESEQRPHKVSYKLYSRAPKATLGALRSALCDVGVDACVIFSGGEDLDILPARASKGKALAFILQQLEQWCGGRPSAGVMVAGDSGNDVELFEVEGVHGCVVANAHPELRAWCRDRGHTRVFEATQDGPGGIIEALERFEFVAGGQLGHPDPGTLGRRRTSCWTSVWRQAWLAGVAPRSSILEVHKVLAPDFEELSAGGELLTRDAMLAGLERAYGSRRQASRGGAFRLWLDRMADKEVGPGICVFRFLEVQQPFIPGQHTAGERTAVWVTGVMRHEGVRYTWVQHQQTPAPVSQGASSAAGPRAAREDSQRGSGGSAHSPSSADGYTSPGAALAGP